MKDKSNMYKAGLRKKIYLIVFLMLAVGGAVVCAAVAAERSGMYWIGLGGEVSAENPEDNKGFFTVDVSDFLNTAGTGGGEAADEGSELVPLAIGPLPSIPTLTDEELKLYGILSKNDGKDIGRRQDRARQGHTLDGSRPRTGRNAEIHIGRIQYIRRRPASGQRAAEGREAQPVRGALRAGQPRRRSCDAAVRAQPPEGRARLREEGQAARGSRVRR